MDTRTNASTGWQVEPGRRLLGPPALRQGAHPGEDPGAAHDPAGPGQGPGRQDLVWDCPACGKPEKYSVVKALGKGGCLVADCRLAGSSDVFVMLANLEGLDFQADFLAVLAKSYELLGLEDANRMDLLRRLPLAEKD